MIHKVIGYREKIMERSFMTLLAFLSVLCFNYIPYCVCLLCLPTVRVESDSETSAPAIENV